MVWKRLAAGLLVTAAVLGAGELVVRTWAPDTGPKLISPLAFQRHNEPISSPGPSSDTVIFGGPDIVAMRKPVGLRIFFFGGSATEGYHMTPWSGFVGWYERMLRQMLPDTPIEVINLGAGGEASRQVAELVDATARQETANLFVVYSGNNEYYELRALKKALPGFDARTELARRRLSGLHMYRHLRRWLLPAAQSLSLDQAVSPVDTIDAEIDQDERELGVLLYGEHLTTMVESAQAAEIPLMLATVADQMRSFAFHGNPPPLSEGVKAGVDALDKVGLDKAAALRALSAVQPMLKTQADHYAVARLLDRGQHWELAKKHYAQAEYLDPRPRRSNEPMRALLKDVGARTGTPVCDAAVQLAQQSPGGITGEDVFIDPCHPNPMGHKRLAEILVRCTVEQGLIPGLTVRDLPPPMALAGADPFRLDHFTERRAQLEANRGMSQEEIEQTIRAFDDGTALGATMAGHHAGLFGLYAGALAWYDLAIGRDGPVASLELNRGLVLQRLHKIEQAREALGRAEQGLPGDVDVRQIRQVLGGQPR
jgi:tetratricopeptide (TPR) repeat protein